MTQTSRRIHYAWIVLAAACVLNVVARADQNSFGVFVDPLVDRFNWSRGDISFAYSLAFLVGLPAVMVMGWLGDRYGARRLMLLAAAVIGVGTILMGMIGSLWQFYFVYGFMVGSMGHAAFSVLLPVIVTRWFHARLGFAMGLYFASQGIGPVFFAPVFRWLIETRGWENSFFVIGVGLLVVLGVFSLFIFSWPADVGVPAYGQDPAAAEAAPADGEKKAEAPAVPLKTLLGQIMIWKLAAIHFVGCVAHAIILAHVVSMATLKGVPGVTAAGILATISGFSVISRFGFSLIADRFGGRFTLGLSLLGQALPVVILFFGAETWVFYLFAVVFGLCYGGEMVGFPIINKQLFGAKAPLGSIYAFEMVGASIGMAVGGWLGGGLFDLAGHYTWALAASVVIGLAGLPIALSLPRHRPPSNPDAPREAPNRTAPVGGAAAQGA